MEFMRAGLRPEVINALFEIERTDDIIVELLATGQPEGEEEAVRLFKLNDERKDVLRKMSAAEVLQPSFEAAAALNKLRAADPSRSYVPTT